MGLTPSLLGKYAPNLSAFSERGALRPLRPVTPALTCSVQSTFTTGLPPSGHGCVGNGWYFRDLSEVWFWRQSNKLVAGEKLWDAARKRDPEFTCAKMFWWYNMYADVDYSVTPRPMYPADGRKIPDVYASPEALRAELTEKFGAFPLFSFWGPGADIVSTKWVADASMHVYRTRKPTLSLVYLPHLDYCLQKYGPDAPAIGEEVRRVDALCGEIIEEVARDGGVVVVLSEYGIVPVTGPVHINRRLREAGLVAVRDEMGHELLDPGASQAFALADHQIAHVYVRNPGHIGQVREILSGLDGVDDVLDEEGKRAYGIDHPRSGELVALAKPDRWFSYYYWLDDARAPDFARTVEIHRKPGYDPVELFIDPSIRFPKLAVAWRLAKKLAGMRTLMDVIPLDASLVKGSHGRVGDDPERGPLFMTSVPSTVGAGVVPAEDVKELILKHVFG